MSGLLIYLDGIPGAGKTSLLRSIKAACGDTVEIHEEEVDKEALSFMLANMKERAFDYQVSRFHASNSLFETALKEVEGGKVVVIDRSPAGDAAFAWNHYLSGNISDQEWAAYRGTLLASRKKRETHAKRVTVRHFYIKISAQEALVRIRRRGREGEAVYSKEYLESVHKAHLALFEQLEMQPTIIAAKEEKPKPSSQNPGPGGRFIENVAKGLLRA